MIDALASEQHIFDHLAPIWNALEPRQRGILYVADRVSARGHASSPIRTIVDSSRGRPILVMRHGDLRTARNAGRERIALGQHGAGQSYSNRRRAYPGGEDQHGVSLFLVPNDHAAARTRAAYPAARVAVVGCPILDSLPALEPHDGLPVVAFSFHWDGSRVAPELFPAWRWYRGALKRIAKRWPVLGHAHPRLLRAVAPYYKSIGIEVVPSFADVLRRADLYACDNSSSLFEFAATGRPVLVLNHPRMRRDVEHGLRFWSAATVGVQVDDAADLDDALEQALLDPPDVAAARAAALDLVYQPRSGGAAMAAAALQRWADA